MGRPTHSRALSVWANGERVGAWRLPARGPTEFAYDPAWVDSAAGRPLSLSLPFTPGNLAQKGPRVLNYFDNLLPDSEAIRKRIAQRYQTDTLDSFDLLQAIGRDCVGAVQLLAEDGAPEGVERIEGTPMSEDEIETMLARTIGSPALGAPDQSDDFRISLAGRRRNPRSYGTRENGNDRMALRPPRTFSNCRSAWSATSSPTSAPRLKTNGSVCGFCRLTDCRLRTHRC